MKFSLQEFVEFDVDFIDSDDLPTAFRIQTEWYKRHCPEITIKELARVGTTTTPINKDPYWNEPTTGKISFDRILKIHAHFELETDRVVHHKTGLSRETSDRWFFSMPLLHEADWMPSIGDHIIRSKITYEITEVFVDVKDYWGHTNVPTIITCKSKRFQFGGNELPKILTDKRI